MTYMTVIGWSIVSFIIGWGLGRTFLRMWFHKELDKLQKNVLEQSGKISANNLKILELTNQLQGMISTSGDKGTVK